jgi:RimJ/RimL family protein N-acetyltransferase
MMKYADFIKDIFDRYKGKFPSRSLKCIPVYKDDTLYAYLRPITEDYRTALPGCVELLSKWRIENPSISTGSFEVTTERTEKWLDNHVINKPDRILFLIMSLDGQPLGHIGFASFGFEEKGCEVDAVLRGVKDVYPGLMTHALAALILWGLEELRLEKITLKVFSDNKSAIGFYERFGFYYVKSIPLVRIVLPGEEKWEIAEQGVKEPAERYYTEMQLDIENWLSQGLPPRPGQ